MTIPNLIFERWCSIPSPESRSGGRPFIDFPLQWDEPDQAGMFKLLIVPLQINIAASKTLCGHKEFETIVDENKSKLVDASTNLWSLGCL